MRILKFLRSKIVTDLTKGLIISGVPSPVKTEDENGQLTINNDVHGYELIEDGKFLGRVKVPSNFDMSNTSGVIIKEDNFTPDGSNEPITFFRVLDTFTNVEDVESSQKLGELLIKWSTS